METKFDDIEWRTPDGTERRAILACSEMYYKDKVHGTIIGAALFLPAVLFLAAGISAMKVKGERQIASGLIVGAVFLAILVSVPLIRAFFLGKIRKRIRDEAYQVAEATVTDKEKIIRRSTGGGCYIGVDIVDGFGDQKRYLIAERLYENLRAGETVLLIRYKDNTYGFYDRFDCVRGGLHDCIK